VYVCAYMYVYVRVSLTMIGPVNVLHLCDSMILPSLRMEITNVHVSSVNTTTYTN
jgi:hypothetical protein